MATRSSYLNAEELEGGRILLFNRPNAKKNVWHMRIYVAGMEDIGGQKVKYYTRSTGELDLNRARRVALETYEKLRDKVRNDEPVFDSTFRTVYELWWQSHKKPSLEERQRLKNKSKSNAKANDKIAWYGIHFKRYWLEYFGDMTLNSITNQVASDYWRWRLSYWDRATAEDRKAHPNHSRVPAAKTMKMERGALREMFGWAQRSNLCRHIPTFEHGIFETTEDDRRPSFDKEEWERLDTYMRERWVKGRGIGDKPESGIPHAGHIRQRQMTRRYIQWITATGMRPAEPLYLKHKHIKKITLENGLEVLLINLPEGKTGGREVYSLPVAVRYYEEIKKITSKDGPDDYLFCDTDGKPSKGYYRTLEKLLDSLNLRQHEATGKNRTAYSFRHFYAETRLEEAGKNMATYSDLKDNMGTGINMLERHYIRKKVRNPENLTSYSTRKS